MICLYLLVVCAVMVGATWVALTKPGQSDHLTQYGHNDD